MLAPPVIVIHGTELVAVQAQRPPVVTATLPFMPVETAEMLVGATLYVQLIAPCVTVTV
jgi:hypothetical protein